MARAVTIYLPRTSAGLWGHKEPSCPEVGEKRVKGIRMAACGGRENNRQESALRAGSMPGVRVLGRKKSTLCREERV